MLFLPSFLPYSLTFIAILSVFAVPTAAIRAELTYENLFRLDVELVEGSEDFYHWIFKQGDVNFYSCGIVHMHPKYYRYVWEGSEKGKWGDFAEGRYHPPYPYLNPPRFWLSKQIHDLVHMNVNTLGFFCKMLDWQQDVYCKNPEAPEDDRVYSTRNFWNSVRMKKEVNEWLQGDPDSDIEWWDPGMPEQYPFTAMINIIPFYQIVNGTHNPPPDASVTWFDFVPDLWSNDFATKAYLRAYLMCADKADVLFSPDAPEEYPFGDDGQGNMVFPESWEAHKPQALCNEKALLFYELSMELGWFWGKEHDFHPGRRWVRKLIVSMDENGDPDPSRVAFAECMGEHFDWDVDAWNAKYENIFGTQFHIESFAGPETPSLVSSDYGDYFADDDELWDFLKVKPQDRTDLGGVLEDDDMKVFVEAVADTFFHLATRAVEEFDHQHLIATCRFTDMHKDYLGPILDVAAKYCDLVSLFRYFTGPGIDIKGLYQSLHDKERPIPIVASELTVTAHWQKGYERCCGRGELSDVSISPCQPGPCPTGDQGNFKPCPCCSECDPDNPEYDPEICDGFYPLCEVHELALRGEGYCDRSDRTLAKNIVVAGEPPDPDYKIGFMVGIHYFSFYDMPHEPEYDKPYCQFVASTGGQYTRNWGMKYMWDDPDGGVRVNDWTVENEWETKNAFYIPLMEAITDAGWFAQTELGVPVFSGQPNPYPLKCDFEEYKSVKNDE